MLLLESDLCRVSNLRPAVSRYRQYRWASFSFYPVFFLSRFLFIPAFSPFSFFFKKLLSPPSGFGFDCFSLEDDGPVSLSRAVLLS